MNRDLKIVMFNVEDSRILKTGALECIPFVMSRLKQYSELPQKTPRLYTQIPDFGVVSDEAKLKSSTRGTRLHFVWTLTKWWIIHHYGFIKFGGSRRNQSVLGRKLAEMHKAAKSEKGFGFPVENTIGRKSLLDF